MKVARLIAERQRVDGVTIIRRWRGDWLTWRGSHWELAEEAAMRKTLYSMLEEAVFINAKGDLKSWDPMRNKIANVAEALGAVTHLDEGVHPPAWEPAWRGGNAHDLVSLNNGILSVESRELIAHDPHFFNLVSVPFDYDPGAQDPRQWLKFLNQLWPKDPESIAVLQEFFGYVLSGRIDLHKILLLVGPTRSGKGVVARILTALIGQRNVAGPTLSSLGTNFGLQTLIGKPLAIISDARLGASPGVSVILERLLSISGEDRLTIDRKYKVPWTGKLSTRFMIISNELPRFGDASGAIANRFVVLVHRRSWLGDENTKLTDQLLEELPGILNWALAGIDSLKARGSFIEPRSSREAITVLQDLTSPVSAFVTDDCVLGAGYEISKDDLFRGWVTWRERNGWARPGTKATFGRDLLAAYPMVQSVRPREANHRPNVYRGIDLKQDSPVPPTTPDQKTENQTVGGGQGDQAMRSENNRGRVLHGETDTETTLTNPQPAAGKTEASSAVSDVSPTSTPAVFERVEVNLKDGGISSYPDPNHPGVYAGDRCRCGTRLDHYTREGFPYCDECGPPVSGGLSRLSDSWPVADDASQTVLPLTDEWKV